MSKVLSPKEGSKISMVDDVLKVPDDPIIPFIEGDGIGKDIWASSVKVINAAVQKARKMSPGQIIQVEVEDILELKSALAANVDTIMLDNFTLPQLREAVSINKGRALLEASGNITENDLLPIAKTGVDYISLGILTKNCQAIDLSMRFI